MAQKQQSKSERIESRIPIPSRAMTRSQTRTKVMLPLVRNLLNRAENCLGRENRALAIIELYEVLNEKIEFVKRYPVFSNTVRRKCAELLQDCSRLTEGTRNRLIAAIRELGANMGWEEIAK